MGGQERCIIEDDYDSEFRYDREPVGVLQGLAPDRVLTIGTVSKALVPAIRLGWVLVPPALAEAVAEEKTLSDRTRPGSTSSRWRRCSRSGRYDRHLRRMRAGVRETARGADRSAGAARAAGAADRPGRGIPCGGASACPGGRAGGGGRRRGERSVGLYGMSLNRSDGSVRPPQLVIGFGHVAERVISKRGRGR